MKLTMQQRTGGKKSESARLRREGQIPAVIYVQGKPAETIAVNRTEFMAVMRHVVPGRLPTTVFTLSGGKGKERQAIIKEIQYHVTSYDVIHLDFEELHKGTKVNVNVPIECVGMADCPGIKLGGALRQVIRYIRVSCLPADMPSAFEFDVREMGPRDVKRLSDLAIPGNVRPVADLNEVAVVIVKR